MENQERITIFTENEYFQKIECDAQGRILAIEGIVKIWKKAIQSEWIGKKINVEALEYQGVALEVETDLGFQPTSLKVKAYTKGAV